MPEPVDPITREIVQNALAAAADEMAMALYRTAYSTIVRDCLDYSTSLCDADGEMIAQGVTIPLHLGSVPFAMEALFAKFGEDMGEGDIFILNDPFEGGMHIPDIFIVKPVFWEGQRVAFAVSTAHHLDLGGRLPGSSACDNTEIFQENSQNRLFTIGFQHFGCFPGKSRNCRLCRASSERCIARHTTFGQYKSFLLSLKNHFRAVDRAGACRSAGFKDFKIHDF